MKKKIEVNVMPNYFCNYSCEYCYLGDLRKDRKIIDSELLRKNLEDISSRYDIDRIGVYGGEISLLPKDKLEKLVNVCKKFSDNIVLISNMSNDIEMNGVRFATSLNYERTNYEGTKLKLLFTDKKNLSINIVITPSILKRDIDSLMKELDLYGANIELVRYSPSKANYFKYDISDKEFEDYLKLFISKYKNRKNKFTLSNISMLDDCLEKKYSPCMDSVIFINPYNKLCFIDFDENREFFHSVESIDDYVTNVENEYRKYIDKCSSCEYFGHCYAEHLNLNEECCGMKSLLKWYEKNIYKDNGNMSTSM